MVYDELSTQRIIHKVKKMFHIYVEWYANGIIVDMQKGC